MMSFARSAFDALQEHVLTVGPLANEEMVT
jgi:hypothetical protein